MEVIYQALADMVTSGAGLLLVGGAYLLWWLSGFVPNLFSPKQWSWKRGLQDFSKVLLMAIILIAATGLADIGAAFFAMEGWDITEGIESVSTFILIGAMSGGFVYYVAKAVKNAAKFFGLKLGAATGGDKEKFDESQKQLADDIKEAIETITTKTDKEHLQESGEAPEELFDDIEITEREAGKGGVNNTYLEPYRSAAQDTLVDPSSCYNRECVSYCAWKIAELTGNWPKRTGGMNANQWVQRLAENGYKKTVSAPTNGGKYIGVTSAGQYGHVVWFEEGSTISEYNYTTRGAFSVRIINPAAYTWVEIKAPASQTGNYVAGEKKTNEEIANEVISGIWGNGKERKARLTQAGYNYDAVQAIVNGKLPAKTTPKAAPKKSTIAIGSHVKPTKMVDYTGHALRQWDQYYIVTQLDGDRAVLTSPRGGVWAAMSVKNLELA